MLTPPSNLPGRAPGEAAVFGVLALLIYLLCLQSAMHGTDWRWLLLWAEEPRTVHPQHPGYLPMGRVLASLLRPFGVGLPGALQLLSALGGALAVAALHVAAFALWRERHAARVAALLGMFLPAWFHFATVIELHAPFLGIAAVGMAMAVAWLSAPSASRQVALPLAAGSVLGLAALVHATGHLLLPSLLLLAVWLLRRHGRRRWLGEPLAMLGGYLVVHLGAMFALRSSGELPAAVRAFAEHAPEDLAAPDQPLAYLWRWWQDMEFIAQFWPTLRVEWLAAYAPLCLLVLVALCRRQLRVHAALLLLAVFGYLIVSVALVHAKTDERGAYLVPLGLPLVLLTQRAVPRRFWPGLVVLTIVCGFAFRGEPGRPPADLAFGRAAVAYAARQPTVFFVADFAEMDGAFLVDPRLPLRVARKEYDDLRAAQQGTADFEPRPEQIAGWLLMIAAEARQQQRGLVFTAAAVDYMEQRLPVFAAAWQQFVVTSAATKLPADSGLQGYWVP